ncbi:unnamed protein product [Orchesella dallaii]|uniref:Uncharacterized protein n=1 Tax=Orchesella dallaii TaxID=48710 RepID=A0ABP1S498_9HEXA
MRKLNDDVDSGCGWCGDLCKKIEAKAKPMSKTLLVLESQWRCFGLGNTERVRERFVLHDFILGENQEKARENGGFNGNAYGTRHESPSPFFLFLCCFALANEQKTRVWIVDIILKE